MSDKPRWIAITRPEAIDRLATLTGAEFEAGYWRLVYGNKAEAAHCMKNKPDQRTLEAHSTQVKRKLRVSSWEGIGFVYALAGEHPYYGPPKDDISLEPSRRSASARRPPNSTHHSAPPPLPRS